MCANFSRSAWLLIAAGAVATIATPGCSGWRYYAGPDLRHEAPKEEPTEITYRLDAAHLSAPMAVAHVEGQQVSYDEVAGSLSPQRTTGTLRITYPHPDAASEFARAEVRIDADPLPELVQLDKRPTETVPWYLRLSKPTKTPADAAHETWVLDIPRAQLDELLGVLATSGHVAATKNTNSAAATLTTQFYGRHYQSSCRPVPELDAIFRQVRSQGQLVAYSRPLTAAARHLEENSNLAMRRRMQSEEFNGALDPYRQSGVVAVATSTGLSDPSIDLARRVVYLPPTADVSARR